MPVPESTRGEPTYQGTLLVTPEGLHLPRSYGDLTGGFVVRTPKVTANMTSKPPERILPTVTPDDWDVDDDPYNEGLLDPPAVTLKVHGEPETLWRVEFGEAEEGEDA